MPLYSVAALTQKHLSVEKIFSCQNCSSDREKVLKLEAEGREFAKFLRSLEQCIYSKIERSEQYLVTECFF